MGRRRVSSSFFVFVVVEHEGHVLLIRERKHGQLWYAPAGGLEPGETIAEAAIRETMEEAGVLVRPLDVVRIEQQWHPGESGLHGWWRFVLRARPIGSPEPKRHADEHSLEARWVRPEDLSRFPLRHPEVIDLVALARDHSIAGMIDTSCAATSYPRSTETTVASVLGGTSR
jgi:phosphatase NudJ